ncbi:DUF2066 domain-containing protein [Hyphococcus luteus]|uniref:DUF2066 domain-containing protein n=1 Tax=Hyphococcus luteus TaxID=2058213 RepID=A0A2S7JYZ0_9PROT|nr:DUF2066 domain-containing protein [Marinicaulis flavus]PQA85462.1 hypothetical protein CW354_21190 [Marinicaulis flavus]
MSMMRQAAVLAAMLTAALLAGLSSALAAGDDVFVVPRVSVQAEANSATAAKNLAQTEGRRKAIEILLRRLTVEEDWPYLPKVVADMDEAAPEAATAIPDRPSGELPPDFSTFGPAPRPVITLTDDTLEELESGFEVYNEKSSAKTYRAYITYRFKPSAVRKLLRDAEIPYSEAQTRTALVLPVLQTQNGLYLWEENNPWMAAWKVRPYNNELTPMTAPLGDLEDSAAIGPREALNINEEALANIADRYAVSQVIVAHAYLRQENGEYVLRVRLINGYRESADIAEEQEDMMDGFDPGGEMFADQGAGAKTDFGMPAQGPGNNNFNLAKPGDVLAEAWFRRPAGNFPALAEEAIEVVIAKHAKPWKKQTLIDHTEAALLEASAYFRSLGEWAKIRAALISTPLVGSVQVRSLSRTGAEMLVRAYGDPQKLIVAMEAQGLVLWTEDGERWLVATPGTAQEMRLRDRRSKRFGGAGAASPVQPASYGAGDETGVQQY